MLSNLEFMGYLAVILAPVVGAWAWLLYLSAKENDE